MKHVHMTALVGLVALAGTARAHVGDIGLKVVDNRIVTGTVDDSGGSQVVIPGARVFGGEIGLDIPGFGEEPGFFAEDGTFVPGSMLSFNVRRALRTWDTGAGHFYTVGPERMRLENPAQTSFIDTPVTDPSGPLASPWGFTVPVGELDDHPLYMVLGRTVPGIYLLELEMTIDTAGIGTSLPLYVVFNDGGDEEQHDAAILWVEENILPAPGAIAPFLAAGLTLAVRRRR